MNSARHREWLVSLVVMQIIMRRQVRSLRRDTGGGGRLFRSYSVPVVVVVVIVPCR